MTDADERKARKNEQARIRMQRYRARHRDGRRVTIPTDIADELPDDPAEFAEVVARLLRRQLFTARNRA